MKRRTCLKTIFAAGAVSAIAGAADSPHPIQLHVDMSVDPAKEKEMLHNFETIFRPAAVKYPGYIDVKIIKLRSALMGTAPAGSELPVCPDLPERRNAPEVGRFGHSPESLAHHREHAFVQELHRAALRRSVTEPRP